MGNSDFKICLLKCENTNQQIPPWNVTDSKDKDSLFFSFSIKETYSLPVHKYSEVSIITQMFAVAHLHIRPLWDTYTHCH